jgi:hypothetical protein
MDAYLHHVSGFFSSREEAEIISAKLAGRGLPPERLRIFAGHATSAAESPADSNDALKDVVVDGTIGAAVGAGVGALAQVALTAANVSLFIAGPLIAPLVMLGWGVSLGGLVGASVGASSDAAPSDPKHKHKHKDGWFADLIGDAISNGQAVLVAETRTEEETLLAQRIIRASVGDYKDVDAA